MTKYTCPESLPCKACHRLARRRERYATDPDHKAKLQDIARKASRTEETIIRNRARVLARYYRLKDDPLFQAKQRARNEKRRKSPAIPESTEPRIPYKKPKQPYRRMAIGLLRERDGWVCHLCQAPLTWDTVSIDHVIPRCIDRDNHEPENLRLAHRLCNEKRGKRLLP